MTPDRSTRIPARTPRRLVLLGISVAVMAAMTATLLMTSIASATPPSGLTSVQPLVSGTLPETIRVKFKGEHGGFGSGTEVGVISVVRYELAPGGTFGWHQHGGPLWVVVAQGTMTFYSDDAGCVGRQYPAGSAFLDPGDHTHTARNEGSDPLVIYVTFMLPTGAAPRIDVPDPGVCPF